MTLNSTSMTLYTEDAEDEAQDTVDETEDDSQLEVTFEICGQIRFNLLSKIAS